MEDRYIFGLLGGLIIGTAGAIYLLVNGRILGPSGSIGAVVDGSDRSGEQIGFLAGLVALPLVISRFLPFETHASGQMYQLIVGGLLVGFGTRLANGCTSGHGVCGISRLSPRGIVSSVIYIAAGITVMALLRGLWGMI
ncbi:MAG: YeeE/YedE thiosulfate transporter family protein [Cypionkella sp.]|nr:YeeE/YedE thiosulfate transporter family protein [Cypionkella sp.]